jgi:hypothetical protein
MRYCYELGQQNNGKGQLLTAQSILEFTNVESLQWVKYPALVDETENIEERERLNKKLEFELSNFYINPQTCWPRTKITEYVLAGFTFNWVLKISIHFENGKVQLMDISDPE